MEKRGYKKKRDRKGLYSYLREHFPFLSTGILGREIAGYGEKSKTQNGKRWEAKNTCLGKERKASAIPEKARPPGPE